MSKCVLDASALLALLRGEPGAEEIDRVISAEDPVISAVNLCEIASTYSLEGRPSEAIRLAVEGLDIDIVAFDAETAYLAAALRPTTRHLGLSLGDRSCLALGLRLGAEVFTADRSWAGLSLGATIRLIR